MDELNKLIKFLKYDTDIKNILINSAPNSNIEINETTIVNYSNYLFNALKNLEFDLNRMIELYPCFGNGQEHIKKLFSTFYNELSNCSSYEKLKNFYKEHMSDLSQNVVDEVGKNCIGYYLFSGVSLEIGTSINELLHIIHQTVINNEALFAKMPKLTSKTNCDNFEINLYGNVSKIGADIFNAIPTELSLGPTDILAISDDKLLMMVRDRGHALTIEVEKENDKYYAKYFIPKICNVNMVNELKGVRKVNSNSQYTNGIFEITENIGIEIADFISKVPTDSDMEKSYNSYEELLEYYSTYTPDIVYEEDNYGNYDEEITSSKRR